MTSPRSAAKALWVPTSWPGLLAEQPAHVQQVAVGLNGAAGVVHRCMGDVLGARHHLHHSQPGGGVLLDVVARLPSQLRLICAQISEPDARLPLADIL